MTQAVAAPMEGDDAEWACHRVPQHALRITATCENGPRDVRE